MISPALYYRSALFLLLGQMSILCASDPIVESGEGRSASQERARALRDAARIYRHRVTPHWIDNASFWYRNDLAKGQREFVFVDAAKGERTLAFDHQAVAQALETTVEELAIDSIRYDSNGIEQPILSVANKHYRWHATDKRLTEFAVEATNERESVRPQRRGVQTGAETSLSFINRLEQAVQIFWVNGSERVSYGKIEPGKTHHQHTFGGHRWAIVAEKLGDLGEVAADDSPSEIIIDGKKFQTRASRLRRGRGNRGSNDSQTFRSPDGKWTASVVEFIVQIRSTETDEVVKLCDDGKAGNGYSAISWSPDSSNLVAFRVTEVERQQVHLVRSSPPSGGRAQLESREYALPGDPFATWELNVFRIADKQQVKPEVDRFEHEWLRPQVRFEADGSRLTYEQTDRGHSRFRLIGVDLSSGEVRNVIDEKSQTFIWTAHNDNLPRVSWLDSGEIVYATEKNGWRQLILIDSKTGSEKRELTPRGIVVRGLESIDEKGRQLWFSASGRDGQDPYLVHHARVDLDSGKLIWLTEGNGSHSIEFSPTREFVIDSYSRVDAAPITELRRCDDGSFVCRLEHADVSELQTSGWQAPQVFSAKGRDGATDIWGIICRPRDFDPAKKYPVIEDIYAGPQGSFVPKSFSPSKRHEALTSLGFIVVQIDGMGTANRSKAFHDVCWKNLKDGGFEDRILWMQAAAEKHPELDLSRVGIYGTSAGGQNAAAAVLFHPEFYKVAVAACGCHDNRMDKASWNEQWMGYPVGSHYSDCSNIDNAHRLVGKLLLIVGEMDTNVPPESTLRFADALIRADKDFDLLVIPNAGHGMGGAYGQRRMHNFFIEHLK